MCSILRMWELLIAFLILNSDFQLCVVSQSFSPTLPAFKFRNPLTLNSTTRKDPTSKWGSSLIRPSTTTSSFQTSLPLDISPTNKTTSILTSLQLSAATPPTTASSVKSQSFLAVSSTASFFTIPTVTSTLLIYLNTNVPQSSTASAPVVLVTNPSDPNQVIPFKTLQIPDNQRKGLPSVTYTAPAALLLPNFGVPVLLFPFSTIVFPAISSLPPWLNL